MNNKNNPGSQANKTGNQLEDFVKSKLEGQGYVEITTEKHLLFENIQAVTGKQFTKQLYVGKTIYDTKRICDFFVFNPKRWKDGLLVECKWQESGGSVDEKFPYLVHNIIKTAVPTIILLDGGGYKKQAEIWLKSQANPERPLLGVWNMREFQKKVNAGFLG